MVKDQSWRILNWALCQVQCRMTMPSREPKHLLVWKEKALPVVALIVRESASASLLAGHSIFRASNSYLDFGSPGFVSALISTRFDFESLSESSPSTFFMMLPVSNFVPSAFIAAARSLP